MKDPNNLISDAIAQWHMMIEAELVRRLEIIEDRVPSNAEVAQHCQCGIHPDGRREYKWKGKTFLVVDSFGKQLGWP